MPPFPRLKTSIYRTDPFDRYARRVVRADFLSNPASFFGLALRNLILAPVLQMTWMSTFILMLWNWPLLLMSSVGAVWCLCRQPKVFLHALPVVVLFCYVLGVHAVVWPQARYIMPAILPLSAFAGLGMAQVFYRATNARETMPDRKKPVI